MTSEGLEPCWDESDIFPVETDLGERLWGEEILLALVPGRFTLKKLVIRAGSKGGLQFHRKKDEVEFLVSGEMIVRFDVGDGNLRERVVGPGSVIHFPPGLAHQTEALTDCFVIEASSPHFNDRVRVEERYGQASASGLPTTAESEIIEK